MKTLEVRTLPHTLQRYDTVGDYQELEHNRTVMVTISTMPDWRSEAAVAIHELVEYFLVKRARVSLESIDAWDLDHPDADEPGDVPDCPYAKQHRFAENIERLLIAELGVTWEKHTENVNAAAATWSRPRRSKRANGAVRGRGAELAGGADRRVRDEPRAGENLSIGGLAQNGGSVSTDGHRQDPGGT